MRLTIRSCRIAAVVACGLCLWHSAAEPRQLAGVAEVADRGDALRQVDSLVEQYYALPDKAKEYAESFRKLWRSGVYDSLGDSRMFAAKVTADLREITKDRHFLFRVVEPSDIGENAEGSLHHPVRYYRLRVRENTGFSRLEWLEGNVGLLEIRRFNSFSEAKEMMAAAMAFLANADAIILDIRENPGGSGDYLSSFFLNHPTQLTGSYSRADDYCTEFWTLADPGAERRTEVPLFVLTSKRTFSAAESFAYDMKVRRRATLIGESTGGGAHSVDLFKIGKQFEIYIPTERAVNPVSLGNWEGTGVLPDVAVPAAAALDTAIILAREAGKAFGAMKEAKLRVAVQEMQVHMESAERRYRSREPKAAKAALDSVFSIGQKSGLLTEFFVNVLAYNFMAKEDDQILYAILTKSVELFPRSSSAYETLAYAYFRNGERERALENYGKALALDPENRNAASMIRRLQHQ
jgi:tetratricopeptide (TPR) repeat protein